MSVSLIAIPTMAGLDCLEATKAMALRHNIAIWQPIALFIGACHLTVKDRKKYAQSFINNLREMIEGNTDISSAELIDSVVVLSNQKSPIILPTYPMVNKSNNFSAKEDSVHYELALRGINYTDLSFRLLVKDGAKILCDSKGTITISPGFILAAEMYEDELSGVTYRAYGFE